MRLISSIEVAERIFVDLGPLMSIALGSGWHISQGKLETIENNYYSAVILCLLFIFFFKCHIPPKMSNIPYPKIKNTNIPVSLKIGQYPVSQTTLYKPLYTVVCVITVIPVYLCWKWTSLTDTRNLSSC